MFSDESSDAEFWCPLGGDRASNDRSIASNMTSAEWTSLSLLAAGEWLSDAQIARLAELGLVERVFGQALLTRLGRTSLHITDDEV